jgi:thiol-disulfide isomerase/thioredoxin
MKNFIYLLIYFLSFTKCAEPKYSILFNETRKIYNFSNGDTIINKGGIISFKGESYFISTRENKGNKFILLGNSKDSFIYLINTLEYYSPKLTINIGGEIQQHPESKREYLKLKDKILKVLSVNKSSIILQKVKKSTEIYTAFEPLLQLPNLRFDGIKKENFNLVDFLKKDKFLLVAVWTSWCPPCIESMPVLDSIAGQFKNNLQVISLNCGDDNSDFEKYATSKNLLYGKIEKSEYKRLNGFGFPYYALFNSNGELISYHLSIKNYNWITSKIK